MIIWRPRACLFFTDTLRTAYIEWRKQDGWTAESSEGCTTAGYQSVIKGPQG